MILTSYQIAIGTVFLFPQSNSANRSGCVISASEYRFSMNIQGHNKYNSVRNEQQINSVWLLMSLRINVLWVCSITRTRKGERKLLSLCCWSGHLIHCICVFVGVVIEFGVWARQSRPLLYIKINRIANNECKCDFRTRMNSGIETNNSGFWRIPMRTRHVRKYLNIARKAHKTENAVEDFACLWKSFRPAIPLSWCVLSCIQPLLSSPFGHPSKRNCVCLYTVIVPKKINIVPLIGRLYYCHTGHYDPHTSLLFVSLPPIAVE